MTTWEEFKKKRPADPDLLERARRDTHAFISGYKLMELRKSQGLRQVDLAERIGVSQKAISKIERGDIENTKIATIRKYVEAVGGEIEVAAIIDGKHLSLG